MLSVYNARDVIIRIYYPGRTLAYADVTARHEQRHMSVYLIKRNKKYPTDDFTAVRLVSDVSIADLEFVTDRDRSSDNLISKKSVLQLPFFIIRNYARI